MHVQPPLIETEMVTLFANTFKAPYYEHLMGSSAQHFYNFVRIAERIEQGIKVGRIVEPLQMEGHVNNFEGGSNDKIVDSYNPQIPTSHVAHINFNKLFSPNRANNQPNNQNNHHYPCL